TSQRPIRSRKQTSHPGMVSPSPDSRRQVSIDSETSIVQLMSTRKTTHTTIDSSDNESAVGSKKRKRTEAVDVDDSSDNSTMVAKKKKKKGKERATSSTS
ncbi:hypothetical protein DFH28DRAFT_832186, partial [Melampsora americana]